MAAIIRFLCGTEAKLLDEDGKWECPSEGARRVLEMWSEMYEYESGYEPYPLEGLVRYVAYNVGAEVVHVDPQPEDNDPPNTIY